MYAWIRQMATSNKKYPAWVAIKNTMDILGNEKIVGSR